jgi:decaprenyl-phosphate phosphoribosyltransferase
VVDAARRPAAHAPVGIALLQALRPRQWVKNVLVAAAPLAAGELFGRDVALQTALAFVVFCCAASSVYLVNDVVDADRDRNHPDKAGRPVASGALPARLAVAVSVVLALVALLLPFTIDAPLLTVTVGTYLALTLAYNLGLKHQRVLDLAIVASGFLLRAIAGGNASDLPLSRWFLIVTAFGSLFVVAGKRYSELMTLGELAAETRPSLRGYSASYLRFVWSIAAAVTITAYCLWAFEVGDREGALPWGPLSVAPFVVAMLRFALDVDGGRIGAPEEVALRDRVLLGVCLAWLVVFSLGAFGA